MSIIFIWLLIAIVIFDVFIRKAPWWQQVFEWVIVGVLYVLARGVLHLIGMAARGEF